MTSGLMPATGSLPHFFALMMAQGAGIKPEVIGYKGSSPLVTDLMGGHVPVAIDALDSHLVQHEAGKIRILATSGAKRALPNVPTFKEAGLDVVATGFNTFYAKASMPADRAAGLSREIKAVMSMPDVQQKFIVLKAEAVAADQAASRAEVEAFKKLWVPAIRQANLQFE
jgi:tripartite-type tricarboxylate transporter receptor subunit TctC